MRRRLRKIAAVSEAHVHIRWGRRKAYDLLRREGFRVNHKRVQRLWREEGLQRPQPPKRKCARTAPDEVKRLRAVYRGHVWAMDFQFSAAPAGHVESFNGRFRDEFLNTELFFSLKEAQVLAEAWRVRQAQPTREYNDYRPHSSLGGQTPTDFAQEWAVNQKLS